MKWVLVLTIFAFFILINFSFVSADCVIRESNPGEYTQVVGLRFSSETNAHVSSGGYSYQLYCPPGHPSINFQTTPPVNYFGFPLMLFNSTNSHVAMARNEGELNQLNMDGYSIYYYLRVAPGQGNLTCSLKSSCSSGEHCVLKFVGGIVLGGGSVFNAHISSCDIAGGTNVRRWCCVYNPDPDPNPDDCQISDVSVSGMSLVTGLNFSNYYNAHLSALYGGSHYNYNLYCPENGLSFVNGIGINYPLLLSSLNNAQVAVPINLDNWPPPVYNYNIDYYLNSSTNGYLTCRARNDCTASEFCVLRVSDRLTLGDVFPYKSPYNSHVASCEYNSAPYNVKWCCVYGGGTLPGSCGDNVVNTGEDCDGSDMGLMPTCEAHGFQYGNLNCFSPGHTNECSYDLSGCFNLTIPIPKPGEHVIYGECESYEEDDEYGVAEWRIYNETGSLRLSGMIQCILESRGVSFFSVWSFVIFILIIIFFYSRKKFLLV